MKSFVSDLNVNFLNKRIMVVIVIQPKYNSIFTHIKLLMLHWEVIKTEQFAYQQQNIDPFNPNKWSTE